VVEFIDPDYPERNPITGNETREEFEAGEVSQYVDENGIRWVRPEADSFIDPEKGEKTLLEPAGTYLSRDDVVRAMLRHPTTKDALVVRLEFTEQGQEYYETYRDYVA